MLITKRPEVIYANTWTTIATNSLFLVTKLRRTPLVISVLDEVRGFWMPLLEAQKLGVPVVCSDRASLPEIAYGTAIHFDPESEEDMYTSIMRCLQSDTLRASLKEKGVRNASRFSWKKAARETMAMYQKLLQNG